MCVRVCVCACAVLCFGGALHFLSLLTLGQCPSPVPHTPQRPQSIHDRQTEYLWAGHFSRLGLSFLICNTGLPMCPPQGVVVGSWQPAGALWMVAAAMPELPTAVQRTRSCVRTCSELLELGGAQARLLPEQGEPGFSSNASWPLGSGRVAVETYRVSEGVVWSSRLLRI